MQPLPRRPWFNSAFPCRLIALVLASACGCSILFAQTGGDDPLPIQQIRITPERAAKELEKVQQGTLLLLPLPEFEERLDRVRAAQQAREQKPGLTGAHYRAELIGRSLTTGSGERSKWTILQPRNADSILPMDPLNLAFAKLNWENGGDAILAEFDGKSLGLLVKQQGNSTCFFDWSARGTPTSEGLSFNLAIPACPISTFEFKLPADSWLAAPKDAAIVTGPHETVPASKRLWKMQVTGSKQISFSVRRIAEANSPAPTVFARVQSTQQVNAERIAVEHKYQIDILHGSVRELTLEGDAALQPYQVSLPSGEIKNWDWQEIAAKKDVKGIETAKARGVLTVQFHQPFQGKIQGLRVRSLAARPAAGLWTSPVLRVRDALSRGETLEVALHPDLAIGKWDHGSFQPTSTSTASDGTQKLTLADTASDAASSRRPSLILQTTDADLHTTENYRWQITPQSATLSAEIRVGLARGSLFEMRIKLPSTLPRYQIQSLQMLPAENLRGWHLEGDFLVVEMKQPLTPARKAELTIDLRCDLREITTGIRTLDYPEMVVVDAAKRQGTLAIHVDSLFQARLMKASVPLAPADEALSEKRNDLPTFRFVFRDQRLGATIQLTPQPVHLQLLGKHNVTLAEEGARLQFRWDLKPMVGMPEFLDFRFAAGFPASWKVNAKDDTLRIHRWERLHLQESLPHLLQLGSTNGMHAAAMDAMLPTGTYWRFHLAEPLRNKSSFTIEATAPVGRMMEGAQPKGAGRFWSLPLMTPVQRADVDQEVTVESPGEPISAITADGTLQWPAAAFQADKMPNQLRLHQGGTGTPEPATKIDLWTRPEKQATSLLELCDEANLATYVHKDGRTYHRLQFRLWHWRDRTCEVRFAHGTQIVAAKLHDHWLERLDVNEASDTRLRLPFDQNNNFVRYEILVRTEAPTSFLPGMRQVEVLRIDLPVAPLELRRRFFLEGDLTPLIQESLTLVGVPGRIRNRSDTLRWLEHLWTWGQSWWPHGEQAQMLERMEGQRQLVLSAEAKLHAGASKKARLSDVLERFALQQLKDQVPLVIDRAAFRSRGLTPDTTLMQTGRPFWETLELVYVPCPSGALLTSAQRMRDLGIHGPKQAAELDDVIQEAILHGRDASAGFFLFGSWLKLPLTEAQGYTGEPALSGDEQAGGSREMTEWEGRETGTSAGSFLVVEPLIARILGWMLAAFLAMVFWKVQQTREPLVCFRGYVLLLTVSILIAIWLPIHVREFFVLPTLLVEGIGLLGCVVRFAGARGVATSSGHSTVSHLKTAVAVGVVLILLAMTWSATAQGPAPRSYTALVIDGPKPAVLVTPELIAKLGEWERQSPLSTSGAVLVHAKYTGKVIDSQAKFDVQFEIYSFNDKASLVIPLTDIQLNEGAFLDGAPVFPAPHKNGYVLPIRAKGPHHLRLSFSARVLAKRDYLDLQFTIPKLSRNEFTLQWPTPVQSFHCLHSLGEERMQVDPRNAVREWHAQVGYENKVHLRWTNADTIPSSKAIEVKESHYWDLRPETLTLLSSLNYSIGGGSFAQLGVTLPEGLHVRSVEALTASATPIVVKNFSVLGKAAQRRLIVDFVQPVTGNLILNLEIVPRSFGQNRLLQLPLPAPLQGKSVAGLVGYRLDAIEIELTKAQNLLAVQGISAEEFELLWKKQSAASLPRVSRAYTFQRTAQQAGLELVIQPNARQAQFHLLWNLDLHHADLHGKFTITSLQEDLIFVEFFIDPAMTLVAVTGKDVGRWHLQNSLLQVWLRQPRKQTTLELVGWRSVQPTSGAAAKKPFVLPCVYPIQTHLTAATLEVRPASRVQVEIEHLRRLRTKLPEPLQFAIEEAPYEAVFHVQPVSRLPDAYRLTKVQNSEHGMEIWHGIRLTTERGQLPTLTLSVKDWPHEPLLLDAPGATMQPIADKTLGRQAWTLKYPAGLPQEVFVTLRGRIAKERRASVSLPLIDLDGTAAGPHWLAWKDVEIVHEGSGKKLTHQKSVAQSLAPYRGDLWINDIPTWNYADAEKALKAEFPRASAPTSVRILASSEAARLSGERQWLHQASYWVHARQAMELRIKFPAPVVAFSVMVDGRVHAGARPAANELLLSLPADSKPRLVEVHWRYADSVERDAPHIAAVQVDQAPLPAHQRLAWLSTGEFAVDSEMRFVPTLLHRLLHEAESHMQIAATLAQEAARPEEIASLVSPRQHDFYACLRQAEYALSVLKTTQPAFESATWLERVKNLKSQNARFANELLYEEQRKAAEKSAKFAPSESVGEDRTSLGIPVLLPPNLPSLVLQSVHSRFAAERRIYSELFVLGAIFLLLFSYFRHAWSLLRLGAPEITIALIAAAIVVYGVSLIGLVLIGALVLFRGYRVVAAVKSWSRRSGSRSSTQPPPIA